MQSCIRPVMKLSWLLGYRACPRIKDELFAKAIAAGCGPLVPLSRQDGAGAVREQAPELALSGVKGHADEAFLRQGRTIDVSRRLLFAAADRMGTDDGGYVDRRGGD